MSAIRWRYPKSKHEWAAILLGLGLAGGTAIPLARGVMSMVWPKADGVITYSGDKPGYRTIGVDVRYQYAAAGGRIQGTAIASDSS